MTAAPANTSHALNSDTRHDRGAELYDAECALHTAHQTRNDAWIDAASAKLHQALTDYLNEHQSDHAERGTGARNGQSTCARDSHRIPARRRE